MLGFTKENNIGSSFLLGAVKELAERILDKLPYVLQEFEDTHGKYGHYYGWSMSLIVKLDIR